jgi:hypothetical protein
LTVDPRKRQWFRVSEGGRYRPLGFQAADVTRATAIAAYTAAYNTGVPPSTPAEAAEEAAIQARGSSDPKIRPFVPTSIR